MNTAAGTLNRTVVTPFIYYPPTLIAFIVTPHAYAAFQVTNVSFPAGVYSPGYYPKAALWAASGGVPSGARNIAGASVTGTNAFAVSPPAYVSISLASNTKFVIPQAGSPGAAAQYAIVVSAEATNGFVYALQVPPRANAGLLDFAAVATSSDSGKTWAAAAIPGAASAAGVLIQGVMLATPTATPSPTPTLSRFASPSLTPSPTPPPLVLPLYPPGSFAMAGGCADTHYTWRTAA